MINETTLVAGIILISSTVTTVHLRDTLFYQLNAKYANVDTKCKSNWNVGILILIQRIMLMLMWMWTFLMCKK
jgi:hypothetical protein